MNKQRSRVEGGKKEGRRRERDRQREKKESRVVSVPNFLILSHKCS